VRVKESLGAPLATRRDLTDGVVLLRQPVEADIPAITSGAGEPSVALYTTVPSPYSESDAVWFLNFVRTGWEQGTVATFAVYLLHDPVHHVWDVQQGYQLLG